MTDEWVFPHEKPSWVTNTAWIKPKDKKEIEQLIGIEPLFRCSVLKKGKPLKNASYIMFTFEDDEGAVLCIDERQNGDFVTLVEPQLQSILR